jgi:hypothetical protein
MHRRNPKAKTLSGAVSESGSGSSSWCHGRVSDAALGRQGIDQFRLWRTVLLARAAVGELGRAAIARRPYAGRLSASGMTCSTDIGNAGASCCSARRGPPPAVLCPTTEAPGRTRRRAVHERTVHRRDARRRRSGPPRSDPRCEYAVRWRSRRDSNPRSRFCPLTPLAGEHLRPLGHDSSTRRHSKPNLGRIRSGPAPVRKRGAGHAQRVPCTSRRSRRWS